MYAIQSDHPRFVSNVQQLSDISLLVLRVRVADERIEVFGSGDTFLFWEQFYVHQLEVQEVFKDFYDPRFTLAQGGIVEIIQFRALALANAPYYPPVNDANKRHYFDLIASNINVGDDLIVFLLNHHGFLRDPDGPEPTLFARLRHAHEHVDGHMVHNGYVRRNFITNRIWGGSGGNPTPNSLFSLTNQVQAAFFYDPDVDAFQSVNPVNNLVLTRQDLFYIKYTNITEEA
ncbi:MAG: hypothetical protein FWC71_08330 [Defluviitaleaceae bacterium]|nr:hypothetical protein [Defluviitaleaceae bacterium]